MGYRQKSAEGVWGNFCPGSMFAAKKFVFVDYATIYVNLLITLLTVSVSSLILSMLYQ